MIKEFEFYHGVVFSKMLHSIQEGISLRSFPSEDNASYIINNNIGIYIKYSAKRLSPWRFTFQQRHQDEILEIRKNTGSVFLLLVCNDDGIVTLSFEELKGILDENHEPVEWISVSRSKREMYAVGGSNGSLKFKIGKQDFPSKIFTQIPFN